MFSAIRSVRLQPTSFFCSTLPNYPTVRQTSGTRFRQVAANHTDKTQDMEQQPHPQPQSQPQQQQQEDKKGDVMSHSFGEGYSSRSNDDGFGGTYGGNRSLPAADEDEEVIGVHVNHPEYDKNQGSEVKEKEKARHQTHDHC